MNLPAFALFGAACAFLYAAALAYNARLYVASKLLPAVALHVARTSAVGAALLGLALCGARPFVVGVSAFAGAQLACIALFRRLV